MLLLKGVAIRPWRSLMSRHETQNCFNFTINGLICTKLHMYDNIPALCTSTWKCSMTVISPPAGDRNKWMNVLDFNVLVIYIFSWSYATQIWSAKVTYLGDAILWRLWRIECGEWSCFAKIQEVALASGYFVKSAWNFTCFFLVLAWSYHMNFISGRGHMTSPKN